MKLYSGETVCRVCEWGTNDGPTITYNGGGFVDSREGFHGQTIGERRAHWIKSSRAAGLDPVPASSR